MTLAKRWRRVACKKRLRVWRTRISSYAWIDLEVQQLLPGRDTGEQVGIPPYGAGFQCDPFGFANARQDVGEGRDDEARSDVSAQRWQS